MTPDLYCQQKAASSGSSFYYSFLFLPEKQRKAITALYAFCREVDDVVDECSDISIARTKLNWWREEIRRLFEGAPCHPVTKALFVALEDYKLEQKYFMEIIAGMEMDLVHFEYNNFGELEHYCYRAASVVGFLSIEIFGYQNPGTVEYAKDLGMALQLTNILRDVREDAQRGRIYIPLDELTKFGVARESLDQSKTTGNIKALFAHQAERALSFYKSALSHLADEDKYTQRTGLIMAAIYQKLLDEIKADGYRVLEHRIQLTPLRKFWIAWRTSRQLQKYKK